MLQLPPVELKKQSSCSIQLTNNVFDHVAFKVLFFFLLRRKKKIINLIYDILCGNKNIKPEEFFIFIFFQVKTTDAKKYCVRPNMGILKPISTCEVTCMHF